MNAKLVTGAIAAGLMAAAPLILHAASVPQDAAPARGAASAAAPQDFPELRITRYRPESLRVGRTVYQANCASCHGPDYRGGSASDLTSSVVVYDDLNGELAQFLKGPHRQAGLAFDTLSDPQLASLSDYLHAGIAVIAMRGFIGTDIVVGDAKAGQAYFNGEGGCTGCHSATGDLGGIGARLDPITLQARIMVPSRLARGAAPPPGPGGGAPRPAAPAPGANQPTEITKNAVRATVTTPGEAPVTGQLVRKTFFEVVIADLQTGQRRSWKIEDGQPKVALTDPLEGHVAVRQKMTDPMMHNLTAYLVSLK